MKGGPGNAWGEKKIGQGGKRDFFLNSQKKESNLPVFACYQMGEASAIKTTWRQQTLCMIVSPHCSDIMQPAMPRKKWSVCMIPSSLGSFSVGSVGMEYLGRKKNQIENIQYDYYSTSP